MAGVPVARDHRTWSDAHLHLWDPAELAPPWLSAVPALADRFDLARYAAEGGVGGAVVLVEADVAPADRAREAAWLSSAARDAGRAHAVVAAIEPGGTSFATELRETGRSRAVSGSRRVLHSGELPFGTERFVEDLRALGSRGLSFDFCVRWSDLPLVERCARAAAETRLVLDHLGNPPMRSGWNSPDREAWQRLVARVAACTNVDVKWSAVFENAGRAVEAREARPWFEWCLEAFGASRVLWGSNWPVCFTDARLGQWLEVAAEIAGTLAPAEQAAILGGNLQRLYRPSLGVS